MKIGIDLDEVTAEFLVALSKFYHAKSGKLFKKEDFFSYNFWEIWEGTREEAIRITDEFHNSDYFNKILPVEKAIDSINSLLFNINLNNK